MALFQPPTSSLTWSAQRFTPSRHLLPGTPYGVSRAGCKILDESQSSRCEPYREEVRLAPEFWPAITAFILLQPGIQSYWPRNLPASGQVGSHDGFERSTLLQCVGLPLE